MAGGLTDARRERPAPPPIRLPLEWLDRKLGRHVDAAEVRSSLAYRPFAISCDGKVGGKDKVVRSSPGTQFVFRPRN